MASASADDRPNKSSTLGFLWFTAKEKSYLLAAIDPDDDYAVDENASVEIAGGFSSLGGMLQWAIGRRRRIWMGWMLMTCGLDQNLVESIKIVRQRKSMTHNYFQIDVKFS